MKVLAFCLYSKNGELDKLLSIDRYSFTIFELIVLFSVYSFSI